MAIDFNTEMDTAIEYRRAKAIRGAGARPAIVVVDFQRAFTETARCGQATIDALNSTAELLDVARGAHVPIVYLTVIYDQMEDIPLSWRPAEVGAGISMCLRGGEMAEINPIVESRFGDIVVEKHHASGFYGTDLDVILKHLGIDTLVMAGTSTSGCVRATAVDAAARSYRVQVVEECVDDVRPISGEAALCDIAERYGDVISLKDAIGYVDAISESEV